MACATSMWEWKTPKSKLILIFSEECQQPGILCPLIHLRSVSENFLNVDQCGVKGKRRDQALQVLAHW